MIDVNEITEMVAQVLYDYRSPLTCDDPARVEPIKVAAESGKIELAAQLMRDLLLPQRELFYKDYGDSSDEYIENELPHGCVTELLLTYALERVEWDKALDVLAQWEME